MMRNKKKIIIICVAMIVLIISVLALWIPAYIDVNERYPSYTVVKTPQGEAAEINAISLRVGNLRLISDEDFINKFELSSEDIISLAGNQYTPGSFEIALVDFEITYNGDQTVSPGEIIDEYIFYIETDFRSSAYDMFLIGDVNNGKLPNKLNKGDKFNITLPFYFSKLALGVENWDEFNSKEFQIAVNYYPYRYLLELDMQ